MSTERLYKSDDSRASANMPDYDEAVAAFSWEDIRRSMGGPAPGMINIAHEAVDRHVAEGRGDKIAAPAGNIAIRK